MCKSLDCPNSLFFTVYLYPSILKDKLDPIYKTVNFFNRYDKIIKKSVVEKEDY